MTINNAELYNNAWDWAILDGCFGDSKIKPRDIDGVSDWACEIISIAGSVEHHNCFLWIETKLPNTSLPIGQLILFRKLAKLGDLILILWGTKNTPQKMKMLWREHEFDGATNIDHLRKVVSLWYEYVHKNWTDRI